MSDIAQLKETLDQIQAIQQMLVEKVDRLVAKSELIETTCDVPDESVEESQDESVEESQEEQFHEQAESEVPDESQAESHEVPDESPDESHEVPHEVPDESPNESPNESPMESQEQEQLPLESHEVPVIDPLARIEEIPKEVQTSKVSKYDLGDGLHYYEEDGICYIDVDKDDGIIDSVRAKIVSASVIRDYIKNGEFEKIKPYVPEDAYNALYNEYQAWQKAQGHQLTEADKKRINEQQKSIDEKSKEFNSVVKQLTERIAGWRRKQLIQRRDTLRREIKGHRETIERIKRGA